MTLAMDSSNVSLSQQGWCTFLCLDDKIVTCSDTVRLCAESRFFREYKDCNSHLQDWNVAVTVPFSSVHLEKFFGLIEKPRFEPLSESLTQTMDLMPFEQLVSLLDFFQVLKPERWLKEMVLDFLSVSNLVWFRGDGSIERTESKVFPNFSETMMSLREKWSKTPPSSKTPAWNIHQIHKFAIEQGHCTMGAVGATGLGATGETGCTMRPIRVPNCFVVTDKGRLVRIGDSLEQVLQMLRSESD